MKLLFKQRMFSWFDSYDIYAENGQTVYEVQGELSWGHKQKIYGVNGVELGMVKEKLLRFTPTFEIYAKNEMIGEIRKKPFKMFKSEYSIDALGWTAKGNFGAWKYDIFDSTGNTVAKISKKFVSYTDTYILDIVNPADALYVLMFVIAIDAEKASNDKREPQNGISIDIGGFKF